MIKHSVCATVYQLGLRDTTSNCLKAVHSYINAYYVEVMMDVSLMKQSRAEYHLWLLLKLRSTIRN